MKIDPERVRSIWSIVLSKDPSAAAFMSADVLGVKPLRIAHFENGVSGVLPANFSIEVSFGPSTDNRTDVFPTKVAGTFEWTAKIRIDNADLGAMVGFPGYEDLLRELEDPVRFETKIAHGLYHEILHAIIAFQGKSEWPSQYKGGLRQKYEQFMLDAKHGALGDSRLDVRKPFDTLHSLMQENPPNFDGQLDDWLTEVFVARESFSAFDVVITNAQLAHSFAFKISNRAQKRVSQGLQGQRERSFKQLEKKLLDFLNRLDQLNLLKGQPQQPKPSPWQWSKGRLTPWGIADRPPTEYVPRDAYSPRVLPWPGSRPFGINAPTSIFRNNILSPPTTSIPPAMPKPWQPPFMAPKPVAPYAAPKPWAPPGSTGLPPLNAQPSVPAFAAGPFHAIAGPPSWAVSQPEAFQSSGPGWDPNRFGFSDPVSRMSLPVSTFRDIPIQANPWESASTQTHISENSFE